ncbi:hypothetical protein EVA_06820 [gut metagenome]|uniref:Uncharacterized protein n=1 Tax=gut metagenome TaxID=749906 RepID=J9GDW3_9ZZZZ
MPFCWISVYLEFDFSDQLGNFLNFINHQNFRSIATNKITGIGYGCGKICLYVKRLKFDVV